MVRRREDERTGAQHKRQGVGVVLSPGRSLSEGDVARFSDEGAELPLGDWRAVHPEGIHRDPVDRRFLRVVRLRSLPEGAGGDPDHVRSKRAAAVFATLLRHQAHERVAPKCRKLISNRLNGTGARRPGPVV